MKNFKKSKQSIGTSRPDLSFLADNWPSSIVARTEISRFTGGTYNPKYMANIDSKGLGPEDSFRIERKVVYPVTSFIKWLQARSRVIRPKNY